MTFVAEINSITLTKPFYIMTKKHLEFLASLINAANNGVAPAHLATLAAAYCAKDNPRFDSSRFFNACGLMSDGTPKPERMYGLENHSL
tara:strand:- start:414 stop:680 length:267 start_codon:yes stop_codon:yes gene_type:complete